MTIKEKYIEALKQVDGWVKVSEWANKVAELYPDLLEKAEQQATAQKIETTGLREISARLSNYMAQGMFVGHIEVDKSRNPQHVRCSVSGTESMADGSQLHPLMQRFKSIMPDFVDFENTGDKLKENELDYKYELLEAFQSEQSDIEAKLDAGDVLQVIKDLKRLINKTNLVNWRGWDMLFGKQINEAENLELLNLFRKLSQGTYSKEKLEPLFQFMKGNNIKPGWTLPTVLLWLWNPEEYYPIKSSAVRDYAKELERKLKKAAPSLEHLDEFMKLGRDTWEILEPWNPTDWIQIQSFIWVVSRWETNEQQLAAPFNDCFNSLDEANRLLDTIEIGLKALGLEHNLMDDPRIAITLPSYTSRTGTLRINYAKWPPLGVIRTKKGECFLQFMCEQSTLPEGARVAEEGSSTEVNLVFAEIASELLEDIDLEPTLISSMKVFKERFENWKGSSYRIHHKKQLCQLFFNPEGRQMLLLNGFNQQPTPHPMSTTKELNSILYGPPGTGKTYSTVRQAIEIIDGSYEEESANERFLELKREGRIEFLTFHQSYSYEDFVEGIRPEMSEDNGARFILKDGVFKHLATKAGYHCLEAIETESSPSFNQLWARLLTNIKSSEDLTLNTANKTYSLSVSKNGSIMAKNAVTALSCSRINARRTFVYNSPQQRIEGVDEASYVTTDDVRVALDGKGAHYSIIAAVVNALKDLIAQEDAINDTELVEVISDAQMHEDLQLFLEKGEKASGYRLKKEDQHQPFVLIIDEINRGNISKILGELITLLESDKRLGAENELSVQLPYSQEHFVVPSNLHLIGTMNTADKSIALVDVALRRRFQFQELNPDFNICPNLPEELRNVMEELNNRIMLRKDRDHRIGHAYFMRVGSKESFDNVMRLKIIPLLSEYFYNDWEGLRYVLGEKDSAPQLIRPLEGGKGSGRNRWQWYYDLSMEISPAEALLNNFSPSSEGGE